MSRIAALGTTPRTLLVAGLAALIMSVGIGLDVDAAGPARSRSGLFRVASTPWKSIEQRIDRSGSARVMVWLDVQAAPQHTLSARGRRDQKARIASARRGLVADISRGGHRRKVRSLAQVPMVALEIDRADLVRLRRSDHAAAVTLDRIVAHMPLERGRGATRTRVAGLAGGASPSRTVKNGWSNQLPRWWHRDRLGLRKTRLRGGKGFGQAVAILDTGVAAGHPWLAGRVGQEACFSWAGGHPDVGFCPGGVSQVIGPGTAGPMCALGYCEAHGTAVAHIAAGKKGVAPGADIIAVQVFHPITDGRGNVGVAAFSSDIFFGMYYIYTLIDAGQTNIAAVNLSLGSGRYSGFCDEGHYLTEIIEALRDLGTATVVASGNENFRNALSSPACVSEAIAVGNSTLTRKGADAVFGRVRAGSNSGVALDVLAPGTDICTAILKNRWTCYYIGTSLAAPQVTGAIAVLRQKRPLAQVDQIEAILKANGKRVRDSRNGLRHTRIHMFRAWKALSSAP